MNNKNIIVLLVVGIGIIIAAYFLIMSDAHTKTDTTIMKVDYIGMTAAEAEVKAQMEGVSFRVVEEDGQPQPTTRDFQEGRINATVEGGVVAEYTVETMTVDPEMTPPVEATVPTMEGAVPLDMDNGIIGRTTAEAEVFAKAQGVDFRVGVLDGVGLPVTMDLRPGRITAEVENGMVVGYTTE